uniref:tRNA (guanosine(18)-2'-O)-methyltransferase TARBP1 n=1 Tax=Myripristis murdjan TaxID=586833 RepID=A0A667YBZ4_9TELE
MHSILIKALLSSSPDYDILFETLSWPVESWPETERVEALTTFIEGFGPLLSGSSADSAPLTEAKRQYFIGKIEAVVWTQCLPLLAKLSEEAAASQGMRCRETTTAACRLLSVCIPLCEINNAITRRLALSVLPSLQVSKGDPEVELPSQGRLTVEVAIEALAVLFPTLVSDEQLTLTTLSSALSCIKTLSDALVSKITVRLLLTLLGCCSRAQLRGTLQVILDDLCSWHSHSPVAVVTERVLLCLTALSDHLFRPQQPCESLPACQPDPRLSLQFWRILQDGLTHRDNVARKRALYLLKRCVALSEEEKAECPCSTSQEGKDILFKWDPERGKLLREFWEDYALVMETLEENQIHVIRPVLNRIDMLIQTTANDSQASGSGLFHPSWLLCVYQRMFHSENKSLMREGVCHLLELQAMQQPSFALFCFAPARINQPHFDSRTSGQSVGDCPELGAKLQSFMATFFSSLPPEHRGSVLLQLIQWLGSRHWGAVPILFLSRALSGLSPRPLLGTEGLSALREVLRCTMITHQVLLRGAAQRFLLNSALCLTEVSAVTLDDVFSFLTHFRADESLCRGTQLWKQLCIWLSDSEGKFKPSTVDGVKDQQHGADCGATNKQTVRDYVQSETERLPDPRDADKLARAILLCADIEKSRPEGNIANELETLLSPLLDTLSRVSTNVYLPLRKADKSLQLTLRLFQLGGKPGCRHVAGKLIVKVADPIQEFILRRLCGELQEVNSKHTLPLACITVYIVLDSMDKIKYHNIFDKIPQYDIVLILQSWWFHKIFTHKRFLVSYTIEHFPYLYSDAGVQGPLLQDWGRIAAQFMRDQWACLSLLTRAAGVSESVEISRAPDTLKAAFGCSVEALALLPSDLVLPVLSFMEEVSVCFQLVCGEESLCVEAVTLTWALVKSLNTNPRDFWPTLKGFISASFHRNLLELTDAPRLTATLQQVRKKRHAELHYSSMVVFKFCASSGVCDLWNKILHLGVFPTECMCHIFIFSSSDNKDDQLPRTCAIGFLSRLDSSNPLHERLMEDLVTRLLKKDKEISKSKVRYYSNSLQHRVKNRVWQTLLLLLPKLKEDFVASLLRHVFEAGFCSNQASVKYLIEWIMILILVMYPQHINSFWSCFSMDQEKTKTSICTFLSVLVHLNIIMPKLKDKAAQWRKALDVILQWCFSHNFSVRLYALLALKRVWSLAEVRAEAEEGAHGLGGLSAVIKACLHQAEAMQSTGNANKNWIRIQEHFFFAAFHPIRDYSVEVLYYIFFEKLLCFSESPSLPLRNPVPDLSQLQPGDWIQQDKREHDREERWAEVQKKITPWRLGIQEQEPELQLVPQQRAARLGKIHGALLVVASLIDKPTNLGGLCRTCEIFGASALVLDSLCHVSDKHFQSLSVSSELWLPLLEVKPVELTDFLQVKKSEGYCIVGVEQTANSQNLQDYQFPEKTLLLLGNEREGIPANLLQLLDVCVEIPQQGVIRSLNVHVSAALLIWEYTRQHLTSG